MANRLEETELLIEKYEAKIPIHRTRKRALTWPLYYSTSTNKDSLDEFINKANIDLIDDYVKTCDQLMLIIRQHEIEPCTALSECNQYYRS